MLNQRRRFIWNLRKRFIESLQKRTGLRNNQKFDQLQGNIRERKKKRRQEEKEDEFVSDEAYSIWKKHYAGKGFVGEKGFSQLISPFKELIEQREWGKFYKHYKTGYAAIVREFYSNLIGRKDNSVFVRGVWVPYGAENINAIYGMEGQKHGSKYKRLADRPNREKIARRLTDGIKSEMGNRLR